MSISPQATYLSTIIPNAVLPASVDVIEIDRSSSRMRGNSINHGGSIRAISKSSLASGDSVSPLLSRRSDCGGSYTEDSHNNSTPMPTSASGSNQSQSQSPSPSSSKGSKGNPQTVVLTEQESQPKQSGVDQDLVSLCSSVGTGSKGEHFVKAPGSESGVSGSVTLLENTGKSRNSTRGLSVTKTKLPPAPPRRTNSLHSNKFTNNCRALVESEAHDDSVFGEVENATENISKGDIKMVTADTSKTPTPVSNSAGSTSPDDSQSPASSSPFSPTQTSSCVIGGPPESQSESSSSSPQKTPSEGGKFERTMSPSSGYSSQGGTPTLSPKGNSPTSPDKLKKKPVKPERSVSRASSAASPSSSLTSLSSGTSEHVSQDVSNGDLSVHHQGSLPSVVVTEITPANNCSTATLAIRELLNIPPHPKVKAPCPPPPETWAHNRRSFELLCGPCPDVSKLSQLQKPEQLQNSTNEQAGTQTEASKTLQVLVEKQTKMFQSTETVLEDEPQPLLATFTESVSKELDGGECPSTEQGRSLIPERVEASVEVQRQEESNGRLVNDTESSETIPKKEPPPVMKKTMRVSHREQSVERKQKELLAVMTEDDSQTETHTSSSQSEVLDGKSETLSVETPKVSKLSPPQTPPPAHHPTPPPSRKTPPSSVSMLPVDLQKVQEEIHVTESCWPPPPPPLEGDSVVFEGGDEVDFPPPPPPPFTSDVMDRCIIEFDVSNGSDVADEEVSETIKDSTEACEMDLPTTNPQTEVIENKGEEVMEVSTDDTADEDSCRPVQIPSPLPDSVTPPPSPLTNVEKTLLVSPLVPPSDLLNPDTLKVKDKNPPELTVNAQIPPPVSAPAAPPPPVENFTPGVKFRKQPSLANRDSRSKELLSRHKSAPIPKEDANIPLVTPSLLQMVRLRSVNMTEDQVNASSEDESTNGGAPVQENSPLSIPGPLNIPQKPIRKSLSLKSPHHTVKASSVTLHTPSMRLQEAIRMKTAAMSSRDGLPSWLGLRSSTHSCVGEPGSPPVKLVDGCDVHKSPASTASFVFSRSTKKVVAETVVAATPETQAGLRQSSAAELTQVSEHSKVTAFSNGGLKADKVPPPVAKKPAHGNINPSHKLLACSTTMELNMQANGVKGAVQPTETSKT